MDGQISDLSALTNLRTGWRAGERQALRHIRHIALSEEWDNGAFRDIVHWAMDFFESTWMEAKRLIDASQVIDDLPVLSSALESGEIALDKIVQLTRFATPETEASLLKWAKTVSLKTVRESADAWHRRDLEDVQNEDRLRSFGWRPLDGGASVSLFGGLPAEQAAIVTTAVDRIADSLHTLPHEDFEGLLPAERAETLAQRRADALVMLASQRLKDDFDADRATVNVYAPIESLANDQGSCRLDDGKLLHPEVARRLTCDGRVQTVVTDGKGEPIGIGRTTQTVPVWLKRLVKNRDGGCVFPGCGDMRYNEAHHLWHWSRGGPTDLDNLVLVCGFHHKAVHEYNWSVNRRPDGRVEWFRPSGRLHGIHVPKPEPNRAEQKQLVEAT